LIIVLNIPFILKWGATGAAWATLLAWLISGSISFVVSQYYYKIIWEYRKIIFIYSIFYMSSLLLLLFRDMGFSYHIELLLKLISISLYTYLGIKIRVLTFENLLIVKKTITSLIFWKSEERMA
jgi:hypothetical protein